MATAGIRLRRRISARSRPGGQRRHRAAARWRTCPADSRRPGPAWSAPCWSRPRPLAANSSAPCRDRQGGRRVVRDVDALRRIGTLVVEQRAAHAEDQPLTVERNLEVPLLIAFLDRGQKVLAAVLDPFDRAAEQAGGERHHHLLGIDQVLCAEPATDIGRDDRAAPRRRARAAAPATCGSRAGSASKSTPWSAARRGSWLASTPRPSIGWAQPRCWNSDSVDAVGGGSECTLAVAVGYRVFGHDVARRSRRCTGGARRDRGAQVRHRRQRLELDLDALRRVLGDRAALRDHHRDRIADVADLVAHQHERGDVVPEVTAGEPDDLAHRLAQRRSLGAQVRHEIVERENRMHAGNRAGRARVDAIDGGVRDAASARTRPKACPAARCRR